MPYEKYNKGKMSINNRKPLSFALKGLILIVLIFLVIVSVIYISNKNGNTPLFAKNEIYIYSVNYIEENSHDSNESEQEATILSNNEINFDVNLKENNSTVCYNIAIFNGSGKAASFIGNTPPNEENSISYRIEDKNGNEAKIGSIIPNNSHIDLQISFYKKDRASSNKSANFTIKFDFKNITEESNKITFDSNGGSEVEDIEVNTGMTISKLPISFYPETSDSAYILEGWYNGEEKLTNETIFNEDVTYVAKWIPTDIYYLYKLDSIGINSNAKRLIRTTAEPPANFTDASNTSIGNENDIVTWYDESSKTQYYRTRDGSLNSIIRAYWDSDYAFQNRDLEEIDTTNWSFYNVNSLKGLFKNCKHLKNIDVSHWDVSHIYNFEEMFFGCSALTSLDISNWNTDNCSNILRAFSSCKALKSLNIDHLNTSQCTDFTELFANDNSLASIDGINDIDVSNITTMQKLFYNCNSFKSIDLSNWNTSNVKELSSMFMNCKNLNSVNLSNWNTQNVELMDNMFNQCVSIKNIDISSFSGNSVTNINSMFSNCLNLRFINMSNFNTPVLYNLQDLFENDKSLYNIEGLNMINVTNTDSLLNVFHNCSSITSLDISEWDISNINDLESTFNGCSSLEKLNLEKWNFESISNMKQTFAECTKLVELTENDVIWNISNVTNLEQTFKGNKSLKSLDKIGISEWNTELVENMNETFKNCNNLKIDCSNWNISSVVEHDSFNNYAPYVVLPNEWK